MGEGALDIFGHRHERAFFPEPIYTHGPHMMRC